MTYFMGIDIGTFESKGTLIDAQGRSIATYSTTHKMKSPKQGYAEHDALQDWWGDFCSISKQLIKKAVIDAKDIKAVGCSAIGPCCLPVDKQGNPLRQAILYGVDVRASKEIDYLNDKLGAHYVFEKYKNPITSQSIGPKILWIKENEPEVYEKTYKFLTSTSFLVFKLTGGYFIDHYTAAYFTPMYNIENQNWDYENLSEFCRTDQLAECRWSNEIVGHVTQQAAEDTGLAEGTAITTGTADAAADAVGVGVFNPGDMLLMLGSSAYIIHVMPKLMSDKRYWAGPYLFKDTYMVASGMSTTGTLTRWFRDNIAQDLLENENNGGENSYTALTREITDVKAGSNGLVILPYFSGERTPINDAKAKGMMLGLTLKHERKHIYQACLEAVGYGIAQHFDGYKEIGMQTHKVVAVGGGTKNQKWMQIISDISYKELLIGDVFGASFGNALLAALSVGYYKSLDEISERISFKGMFTPDKDNHEIYQLLKEIYTKLYQSNKKFMHQLDKLSYK